MITRPVTWEQLHQELPTLTDLGPTEQSSLGAAYRSLEERFGTALFAPDHPIERLLQDGSTWCRRFLGHFATQLGRVNEGPGFDTLCKKLAHTEEAGEALDVLACWDGLLEAGCTVEYEPRLPHKHGSADLLITMPQESYVELSNLDTSVGRRAERDTRMHVMEVLLAWPAPIVFAGRISTGLSPADQEELLQTIRSVLCTRGFSLCILDRCGVVLGIAPLAAQNALVLWASEHGLAVGNVTGPSLPPMEFWRMQRKIREKSIQLPPGFANLLIVYSHEVSLQYAVLPEVLGMLDEELRQYPQIAALVLKGLYWPLDNASLHLTHHGHRIMVSHNGFAWEASLILYNPLTRCAVSPPLRLCIEQMLARVVDFTIPAN